MILTQRSGKVNPHPLDFPAFRIRFCMGYKQDSDALTRECQIYAKKMKDVVDAQSMTQEQYDDILGCRVSIANAFCSLLFGEKFDEIAKGYLDFISKTAKAEAEK